jgi:hypothetical protein
MLTVGLLYVGAVLFLNGLLLIGVVEGRSAAPLNLFVGALQVVTPTYLIFTAAGDPQQIAQQILVASGLYLFGFTYLYVGIGLRSATRTRTSRYSATAPSASSGSTGRSCGHCSSWCSASSASP